MKTTVASVLGGTTLPRLTGAELWVSPGARSIEQVILRPKPARDSQLGGLETPLWAPKILSAGAKASHRPGL